MKPALLYLGPVLRHTKDFAHHSSMLHACRFGPGGESGVPRAESNHRHTPEVIRRSEYPMPLTAFCIACGWIRAACGGSISFCWAPKSCRPLRDANPRSSGISRYTFSCKRRPTASRVEDRPRGREPLRSCDVRCDGSCHSILIPALLIISFDFSASALISAANSPGETGLGFSPWASSAVRTSGRCNILLKSAFRRATTLSLRLLRRGSAGCGDEIRQCLVRTHDIAVQPDIEDDEQGGEFRSEAGIV